MTTSSEVSLCSEIDLGSDSSTLPFYRPQKGTSNVRRLPKINSFGPNAIKDKNLSVRFSWRAKIRYAKPKRTEASKGPKEKKKGGETSNTDNRSKKYRRMFMKI
jgi:hypothetical protein